MKFTGKRILVLISLIIMLTCAVARTNFGIWNTDIPLGDESGYIADAFSLYQNNSISSNAYLDTYIFLFHNITKDPISAHYYVRFIASLLSVIGLFLFLSSLREVSLLGAFVMALLWNLNILNTPLIQYGNVSLFAFALACIGGYLWLANLGRGGKFCSLALFLMVVMIRPEYALLIMLLMFRQITRLLKSLREHGLAKKHGIKPALGIGLVVVTIACLVSSANIRRQGKHLYTYVDEYLFLGFNQCYTSFAVTHDPTLQLDPMREYDAVMENKFPGATGFFEAVLINPKETGRYFFYNGITNITKLQYLLGTHSVLLPTRLRKDDWFGISENYKRLSMRLLRIERLLICLSIAFGCIWFSYNKILSFISQSLWTDDSFILVFGLASVALTPLLLLLPDPRYWITIIPLFFWGPAAFISKYCLVKDQVRMIGLSTLLSLVFVNPVFTSSLNRCPYQDKDVVLALRNTIHPVTDTPIKALGLYSDALLSYAIPGRWDAVTFPDIRSGASYESLVRSKKYGLFIIPECTISLQQYKKEQSFFTDFVQSPQRYGYKLLLNTRGRDGEFHIYQLTQGL